MFHSVVPILKNESEINHCNLFALHIKTVSKVKYFNMSVLQSLVQRINNYQFPDFRLFMH